MTNGLQTVWARSLLRCFAAGGVREVVVSPGARSAPLVLAAERVTQLRVHPIVDERSAAFFALGIARATGVAPLVICTSGTAGGHALPAVLEADRSHLPLIVVTADRPPELHDCGAPQTVDQVGLFGKSARRFVDLGPPDAAMLGALARVAAQCVLATRWPVPGPVHVNARFRAPLEPTVEEPEIAPCSPVDVFVPRTSADPAALDALEAAIRCSERGIIACGAAHAPAADAPRLAALSGYPLFAETTSQLRGCGLDGPFCNGLDAVLRVPELRSRHAPELVLQLGMPPISAGWSRAIADWPRARRFVVAAHGWPDPEGSASMVIADPSQVAGELVERLAARPIGRTSRWLDVFTRADEVAWDEVGRALDRTEVLVEGHVARAVATSVPSGSLLALGSSLPLRDIDTFARSLPPSVRVLHQRGANGIDGLVAAAAGAQIAAGRPLTLLCGDLSLLHDVGSLAVAARAPGPLVIVVVQNDGGRIFDELELGCPRESQDKCFTMPHGLDLEHAAHLYGLAHARVDAPGPLDRALGAAQERRGATLIEAVVEPARSSALRRALWSAVAARLASSAAREWSS